jgi:2-dehydro-3-deoxy-D-arabinonate dehydratase
VEGHLLPGDFQLGRLLELPATAIPDFLSEAAGGDPADDALLAPVDETTEVWAAGVTYLRSREAREAESTVNDVYSRVYEAERPELFFKAPGT